MKATLFKTLVFTHRYLGIGLGILMLMWCLSGLVMVYVSYPEWSEAQRLTKLPPVTTQHCCEIPEDLFEPQTRISKASVAMLADHPVLRVTPEEGAAKLVELQTGERFAAITPELAAAAVLPYVNSTTDGADSACTQPILRQVIELDQWTVYPRYRAHRPLYQFALQDVAGTEVYVSGTTGEVVQLTTRTQRFWNWVGAVPHWLYFTAIRERAALWNNLVIYSSLLGCFLTVFGLALGVWQLRRKRDGKLHSPYRGWKYWHHVPGLLCGVLLLTWVFSGLTSMQPWGWLESAGEEETVRQLRGELPSWQTLRKSLQQLPRALPDQSLQVVMSVQQGQLLYLVNTPAGQVRMNDVWQMAPATEATWQDTARLLNSEPLERLTTADAYWYELEREPASLPVMRAINAAGTRFYFDVTSGELLRTVDDDAQGYRWWHSALHRLDFAQLLRQRPWRDLLMWTLLLGASGVCVTGVWLGVRRLRR